MIRASIILTPANVRPFTDALPAFSTPWTAKAHVLLALADLAREDLAAGRPERAELMDALLVLFRPYANGTN